MEMNCPVCGASILLDDVNVARDIALCRACGNTSEFSALARPVNPPQPMPGAWDLDDGVERRIGATTRSPMAFFIVPFMCVWSGFSLGGIYGSQIVSGKFNPFMSLFGIPFVLGTIIFGSLAAMCVCGKVELRIRGDEGEIFEGIGPLGWRRRFSLSEFSRIAERRTPWGRGGTRTLIDLEGSRRLSFGSLLSDARRYFVVESLRPLLRGPIKPSALSATKSPVEAQATPTRRFY